MQASDPGPDLSVYVVGEIRARLARDRVSLYSFAETIDKHPDWVVRRLGRSRSVGVTLEDLQVIADGLGCPPADLFPGEARPIVVNTMVTHGDPAAIAVKIRDALSKLLP